MGIRPFHSAFVFLVFFSFVSNVFSLHSPDSHSLSSPLSPQSNSNSPRRFKEWSFHSIKQNMEPKIVVFHDSSEDESASMINTLESFVNGIDGFPSEILLLKCDRTLIINAKAMEEAMFSRFPYVFTQTPTEGIRHVQGVEAVLSSFHSFQDFVEDKFNSLFALNLNPGSGHRSPSEDSSPSVVDSGPSRVVPFVGEEVLLEGLDPAKRWAFVFFHEEWCEPCKQIIRPFERLSKEWLDDSSLPEVSFVSVACSQSKESAEFCGKNLINSYPLMMLFSGEDKWHYPSEMGYSMSRVDWVRFIRERMMDEELTKDGISGKKVSKLSKSAAGKRNPKKTDRGGRNEVKEDVEKNGNENEESKRIGVLEDEFHKLSTQMSDLMELMTQNLKNAGKKHRAAAHDEL
jgi:thiol-disulfide isomerase/thioredoxin